MTCYNQVACNVFGTAIEKCMEKNEKRFTDKAPEYQPVEESLQSIAIVYISHES